MADHNAGAPVATAALATMLSNMRRREILIATILPDSNHTLHAVIVHPGRQNMVSSRIDSRISVGKHWSITNFRLSVVIHRSIW